MRDNLDAELRALLAAADRDRRTLAAAGLDEWNAELGEQDARDFVDWLDDDPCGYCDLAPEPESYRAAIATVVSASAGFIAFTLGLAAYAIARAVRG